MIRLTYNYYRRLHTTNRPADVRRLPFGIGYSPWMWNCRTRYHCVLLYFYTLPWSHEDRGVSYTAAGRIQPVHPRAVVESDPTRVKTLFRLRNAVGLSARTDVSLFFVFAGESAPVYGKRGPTAKTTTGEKRTDYSF